MEPQPGTIAKIKIIVDTNIVFSGILNTESRIGKLLLYSEVPFQFYSCNYLKAEISRHWTKLLKLTGLSQAQLAELEMLMLSRITFINEKLISPKFLLEAENLLLDVDMNDVPFVALTMSLGGKLWTGDLKLCNGLRARGFTDVITTAELIPHF